MGDSYDDHCDRVDSNPNAWKRTQGDLFKKEGIDQVLSRDPSWESRAVETVKLLSKDYPGGFTFGLCQEESVLVWTPEPHHPNAWGAVMSRLAQKGIIVRTERMVASKRPEAHGRRIPVWIHRDYVKGERNERD